MNKMKKLPLTKNEKEFLDVTKRLVKLHGTPTCHQLGTEFHGTTKSNARVYLLTLERKGWLKRKVVGTQQIIRFI